MASPMNVTTSGGGMSSTFDGAHARLEGDDRWTGERLAGEHPSAVADRGDRVDTQLHRAGEQRDVEDRGESRCEVAPVGRGRQQHEVLSGQA